MMSARPVVAVLAGVALVLGAWAWAQSDAAAQQMGPAGQGMMGPGGMMGGRSQQGGQAVRPGTAGPRHRPGPPRGGRAMGWDTSLFERPLISEMLSLQGQLGLSSEQVQRLQTLRSRFEKEAIRQQAEIRAAEVDLSDLLSASPPDLGKIESQVTKIAGLTAKLRFARIKTIEEGRTALSQEQWQKFEPLVPGYDPMEPYGGPGPRGQFRPGAYDPYGMMPGGMGRGMMGGYGGPGGVPEGYGPGGGYGPGAMMGGYGPGMMGPGMMGRRGQWSFEKRTFKSNGERIYYTGISAKDGPIPISGGPMWLHMGPVGCVACHGVTGRGGVPVMMGTAVPEDIRFTALTAPEHKEEGGQQEETDHPPYTEVTIQQAITKGLDPAGKLLDWTMPRWDMTDQDVNDVIAYLKTLR